MKTCRLADRMQSNQVETLTLFIRILRHSFRCYEKRKKKRSSSGDQKAANDRSTDCRIEHVVRCQRVDRTELSNLALMTIKTKHHVYVIMMFTAVLMLPIAIEQSRCDLSCETNAFAFGFSSNRPLMEIVQKRSTAQIYRLYVFRYGCAFVNVRHTETYRQRISALISSTMPLTKRAKVIY